MTVRSFRNLPSTALALAGIYLNPLLANAQSVQIAVPQPESAQAISSLPPITIPSFAAPVPAYVIQPNAEASLTTAQKIKLLQQKVKYVFVLFQENRSFDFYFASYPGAEGIYQHADGTPNTAVPGFTSPFVTSTGSVTTISPFKIPTSVPGPNNTSVPIYPADIISVDHSHGGYINDLDIHSNVSQNDGYALDNEGVKVQNGVPSATPSLAAEQKGEAVMGHIDCDVAGIYWNYATRFTLFDNFHQTITGPSTPNAIAMIAGQSGETQWVEHGTGGNVPGDSGATLPVVADPDPYWGSSFAQNSQPEPGHTSSPSSNLTFATLPLSFMGNQAAKITAQDLNPAFDLLDVQADIEKITTHRVGPVNWGWFQEGYNANDYPPNVPAVPGEPTSGTGPNSADGSAGGDYIAHHNAPQYFGYLANNPVETANLHGLTDFFSAVSNQALPTAGGVFYVRGGYNNIAGTLPWFGNGTLASQTKGEQLTFAGNDDHPGYSDSQISAALIAQEVNAIANSPYWSQSAIIISYDETDGFYDHVQPSIREWDPQGNPLAQGPRIPNLVISPYAVVHGVSHVNSEHGSVIRFIDELFNLIPLADLPNEYAARQLGATTLGQPNLGPSDDFDGIGDLMEAFDNNRLTGSAAPLPASYAVIPAAMLALPQYNNQGCSALGITPTDILQGATNPLPADFNPRPSTAPGIPSSGTWVP